MAIFLLIYIILCLAWFVWAGLLTFLTLKYKYPDKSGVGVLLVFWAVSITIFIVSAVFIARADWHSVPDIFSNLTMGY
jgi:hypothetical protein